MLPKNYEAVYCALERINTKTQMDICWSFKYSINYVEKQFICSIHKLIRWLFKNALFFSCRMMLTCMSTFVFSILLLFTSVPFLFGLIFFLSLLRPLDSFSLSNHPIFIILVRKPSVSSWLSDFFLKSLIPSRTMYTHFSLNPQNTLKLPSPFCRLLFPFFQTP